MQFNYASPMDRYYSGNRPNDVKPDANIEKPIIPFQEIGQTATEGRQFGTFLQSTQAAIRAGTGRIELQPGMGGGEEPVGVESYGQEARQALREIARVNNVQFTSVHTPPNIGNLSGFDPRQGFSDETRNKEMDEVREAIKFAAEATEGGGVVIHTGEYPRTMFDASWNKTGKWKDAIKSYSEEPERAVKPLVDVRTGRVISEVRMNQLVPRPVWNRYEKGTEQWEKYKGESYLDENGQNVKPGAYIDYEGRLVNTEERMPKYDKEKNTFLIHQDTWGDLVKEADEMNHDRAKKLGMGYEEFIKSGKEDVVTPEEAFLFATTQTQEAISRGWAGNYSRGLRTDMRDINKMKQALEFYQNLEKTIPKEDIWKVMKTDTTVSNQLHNLVGQGLITPNETKLPSEIISKSLQDLREDISSRKEMVTGQLEAAENQKILRENTQSAAKYAIKQSMKSYAEMGIEAMQQSHSNRFAQRDIFLAPENIFPEMGYGSHPQELIELVKGARKEMAQDLIKKYGMGKSEAEKEAKDHIKATLDTQHLGMWFNSFESKPNEDRQQRKKRFDEWYLDQIKNLAKEDVIGNIHLVDAIGGGHQHLPAGQGDLPLKQAIKILKENGYKGAINSEAYGEEKFGAGRILLETWREFGSNIYSSGYGGVGMPSPSWGNVRNSYFGRSYPPYFIFGAYSPSNDWTLWSQVPME